ncbi:potassium/sodium hyperpolarization-activated cyclic nucleotide-gated channel 3-like [Hyposmocoma kahamanoa]|uniref:potassium/sodium hyperpolarization-activated cyclic nucleotide-gated channel 3-like n=1 Tax=Hyposmocoma kahamanoa TaxID=1477025 RepID=UPI000E6D9643|nr:potassium/sodium hyperpolarization-activated cyclic nucleotide-gated channel 3-like [Hyposmocoma kahamanoa]
MAVHVALLLYLYLQWNIFFQFATEYYGEGTFFPENPRNCSWMTTAGLWNETLSTKFVYSLHRAVAMLRENTGIITTTEANTGCFEYFFIISWIVAKIIILQGTFNYTIKAFGLESARAKYFIMAKQVQTFMELRKFPPRLKKKILKFYAIRFQSHFFVESRIIACMSGQLREDILMHSGRQLISDVEFLKTLPRQLHLQIGMKLGIVIFIAGDIILKINTSGDCMYFIDRGTVAIYSESGKEVCHLHDGDFFGEIALVMKHRFRTASVVAVTNCELFRLERADFESSIACYPTVLEEIKRVATNRMEKTRVMDDHYRSEIRESMERRSIVNL